MPPQEETIYSSPFNLENRLGEKLRRAVYRHPDDVYMPQPPIYNEEPSEGTDLCSLRYPEIPENQSMEWVRRTLPALKRGHTVRDQYLHHPDADWSNPSCGKVPNAYFGRSVAMTKDGTRLMIGAPGVNKIFVYVSDPNNYDLYKVVPQWTITGSSLTDQLGTVMHCSNNGEVLVSFSGQTGTNKNYLQLYAWKGDDKGYVLESDSFPSHGAWEHARQSALSGDGNTFVMGDMLYSSDQAKWVGRVWIYKRLWKSTLLKYRWELVFDSTMPLDHAVNGGSGNHFGASVAVSKDGRHVAISAMGVGKIFGLYQTMGSDGRPTYEYYKATTSLEGKEGLAIAIDGESTRLATSPLYSSRHQIREGGPGKGFSKGWDRGAYEFTLNKEPENTWLTTKLTFSGDGETLITSDFYREGKDGFVYLYRRNPENNTWTYYPLGEEPYTSSQQTHYGWDHACSEDGSVIVISAPLEGSVFENKSGRVIIYRGNPAHNKDWPTDRFWKDYIKVHTLPFQYNGNSVEKPCSMFRFNWTGGLITLDTMLTENIQDVTSIIVYSKAGGVVAHSSSYQPFCDGVTYSNQSRLSVNLPAGEYYAYVVKADLGEKSLANSSTVPFAETSTFSDNGLQFILRIVPGYLPPPAAFGDYVIPAPPPAPGPVNGTTYFLNSKFYSRQYSGQGTGTRVLISRDGMMSIASGTQYAQGSGVISVAKRNVSNGSWQFVEDYLPPFTQNNQQFGLALALNNDRTLLAVGVPWRNGVIPGVGAVFIYSINPTTCALTYLTTVKSTQEYEDNGFGIGVGLSGDGNVLIVASHKGSDGRGNIQIFLKSGSSYVYHSTVKSPNAVDFDNPSTFGNSMAISDNGNVFVVGHEAQGPTWDFSGRIDVWKKVENSWVHSFSQTGAVKEGLGWGVSMTADGTKILASAFTGTKLYVAEGTAWRIAQIFESSSGGSSISPDGSAIAICDHLYDISGAAEQGIVYLYKRNADGTYTRSQIINGESTGTYQGAGGRFGTDSKFSYSGDYLVIGEPGMLGGIGYMKHFSRTYNAITDPPSAPAPQV